MVGEIQTTCYSSYVTVYTTIKCLLSVAKFLTPVPFDYEIFIRSHSRLISQFPRLIEFLGLGFFVALVNQITDDDDGL